MSANTTNTMSSEEFKEIVESLNTSNYSFANEMLYLICQTRPDILNADQTVLAGKIEMVGRIYAASPERRSYSSKDCQKEIDSSVILHDYGDGQGGFFTALVKNLPFDNDFDISCQYCVQDNFVFDLSIPDLELLYHSIRMVLRFNQMIKHATIKADKADEKEAAENLVVKNQISFCSKFLHFHFPNHVFIIDSYSSAGSSHLFPAKNYKYHLGKEATNIKGWLLLDAAFEGIDNAIFQNKVSERISYIQNLLDKNNNLKTNNNENIGTGKNQDVTENAYTQHAIRAYLACCLLQKTGIIPSNQIKEFNSCMPPINSYPRLADRVLMNIKPAPKPK